LLSLIRCAVVLFVLPQLLGGGCDTQMAQNPEPNEPSRPAPPTGLEVDAGVDKTIAAGKSVRLVALVAGGDAESFRFRWSPSDGLSDATVADPLAAPDETTTYVVEVTDENGLRGSDRIRIVVAEPLRIEVEEDALTVASGDRVRLSAGVGGGVEPYRFVWLPGESLDDQFSDEPLATPSQDTTYTVTVTDDIGQTATAQVRVAVTQPPSPDPGQASIVAVATFDAELPYDADGDGSETVVLDGSASRSSAGSIVSYQWIESGVEIAGGVSPTVNLATGRHEVSLQVEDAAGNSASTEFNVVVLQELSLDAGPDQRLTAGVDATQQMYTGRSDIDLAAAISGGSGSTQVTWTEGAATIATGLAPDNVSLPIGVHEITCTGLDGALNASAVDSLRIIISLAPATSGPGSIPLQSVVITPCGSAGVICNIRPLLTDPIAEIELVPIAVGGGAAPTLELLDVEVLFRQNQAIRTPTPRQKAVLRSSDGGDVSVQLRPRLTQSNRLRAIRWKLNDILFSTARNPVAVLAPGTHIVTLEVDDLGADGRELTVRQGLRLFVNSPRAQPIVSVQEIQTGARAVFIRRNRVTQLIASIAGGSIAKGTRFTWSPATGLIDPDNKSKSGANLPNPLVRVADSTTYVVTITDKLGRTDQSQVYVVVTD
jgi:hypothetical protein